MVVFCGVPVGPKSFGNDPYEQNYSAFVDLKFYLLTSVVEELVKCTNLSLPHIQIKEQNKEDSIIPSVG
jgi:hypothetical protein